MCGMETKYTLGRSCFRTIEQGEEKEWLLTNGIGGLANKTITGSGNRNHSGYLIASLNSPVDRWLLLANVHEGIEIKSKDGKVKDYDLASQEYVGFAREGQKYLNRFELDIVPTYIYQAEDVYMKKTIAMEYGKNTTVICYEVENGMEECRFKIVPLFNCKPYGESMERSGLKFDIERRDQEIILSPTEKETAVEKAIGAREGAKVEKNMRIHFYTSEGSYYDRSQIPTSMATPNYMIEENEYYRIDNRNGFLGLDNHFTPYEVRIKLQPYEKKSFYIICSVEEELLEKKDAFKVVADYKKRMQNLMDQIEVEDKLAKRLAWAADSFIVKRNSTGLKTILAGYPWFLDWGRDTMIALQGLTLCTKRYEDAREILESFSKYVKDGMLPNVFPSYSFEEPMYNTIDASLWYFYSVYKYLEYTGGEEDHLFIKEKIYPALEEILKCYKEGTHFQIQMDQDSLIQGGSDKDQLTWMDVKVGEWVVTPRHGKAVEINALWYNALKIMAKLQKHFGERKEAEANEILAEKVKTAFVDKFWNEEKQCLYDCIEIKKEYGEQGEILQKETPDDRIRPNQIWAVSLPFSLLDEKKEKKIVQVVYKYLYTPYGIRSLTFEDKEYKKEYIGRLINRDAAYHMGTTWGYISGAFISAYCKVNHHSRAAVEKAQEMCEYFADHMEDGCLNGIAEIFDGDFSCTSRGCYTQAWSVGEIMRAYMEDVLPYRKLLENR